jgi:hypothetical protein
MFAMVDAAGYLSSVPWPEEGLETVAAIWRALPDACTAWDAAWDDYVHVRGLHHGGRPFDSDVTDRREHWEVARDACLISFRGLVESGELIAEARPWSNLPEPLALVRSDMWPQLRLVGDSTSDLRVVSPGDKRLFVIFRRKAQESVDNTVEPLGSTPSEPLELKPKSAKQQLVLKYTALAYPEGWQPTKTRHIMKKAGELMKEDKVDVPKRDVWLRALGRRPK